MDLKWLNPSNADLNPICHLLVLLGAHPLLHISRIRVKTELPICCVESQKCPVVGQSLSDAPTNKQFRKISVGENGKPLRSSDFSVNDSRSITPRRYASLNDGDTFLEMRR